MFYEMGYVVDGCEIFLDADVVFLRKHCIKYLL